MNPDCIFCKIIAGEIPCYKVYENEEFLAFLDINPLNEGHSLVIPKKHYRWVWDVENFAGYAEATKKVARALRKVLDTEWVVSLIAGEEVPHAHIWLIPRLENDGHGGSLNTTNVKKIPPERMEELAKIIYEAVET